jgi:hypothetical protein
MKIKEITLLETENYFTRSDGECTTYNYEIFLENDEKLLIKDLKKPIPDWAKKNAIIEYGLKAQSKIEVKYFIIKNQYDTPKVVL